MPESVQLNTIEALRQRLKARTALALSLARSHRFVVELEPVGSDGPDPFEMAASGLRAWRLALRNEDVEAALDAVERTWALIEVCRLQVVNRDAAIEAFRVRWACENAPLDHQTIDSLARFYRLLPFSTSSQSKYEYVLTRRLAGPIGPERRLAPAEELRDAVVALERSWGASPVAVDEGQSSILASSLQSFADEAARQPDVASFTASALLRRFGSFKASIGPNLFDPRVSVAVVETNVKVLNVLNQLLADAGGQPLRAAARAIRRAAPSVAPPSEVVAAARAPEPSAGVERGHPSLQTGEIDISGLEIVRAMRRRAKGGDSAGEAAAPSPVFAPEDSTPVAGLVEVPEAPIATGVPPEAEPVPARRPDLKTGEVDLSGLEFVRRWRPKTEATPVDAHAGADLEDMEAGAKTRPMAPDTAPPPAAIPGAQSGADRAPMPQVEQLPSARAFELGRLEENAELIDRYLTRPRSPEVWQLDLDVFLPGSQGGVLSPDSAVAERRRALALILTSDDLICARATQDEAPSVEHRAYVRTVANAMLLLRTSLRRTADLAMGNDAEREPLLYVADHLLWERLRLEASLKRKPRRRRPQLLPRTSPLAEATLIRTRAARRQRRILVRVVAVAAGVTTLAGLLSFSLPRQAIDPEVRTVQVRGLPGADLFDDARAFRTTLFVSVSRTWTLLSLEERRSIVRGLGAFAAERGLDTVSVVGPKGEPWATFKDDEVLLDGELTADELARR
jgi:hypothetical protein